MDMGIGIIVCGLNGAGKSTLGKVLAERLHFHFIDNEDLYFPKTDPNYLYASPRTKNEVEKILFKEIKEHENFVYAAVKCDYEAVSSFFQYAVLIDVPKDVRIKRVKNRSYEKFGKRMLSGGDLYEREESFFRAVEARKENTVSEWLQSLNCLVIQVDGTKSIEENVNSIIARIFRECDEENKTCLFKQCAKSCADTGVLEKHQKLYEAVNHNRDEYYSRLNETGNVTGEVVVPGREYIVTYPECGCDLYTFCGLSSASLCECSRQSILYVEQSVTGENITVERLESVLDGGKVCRFRIRIMINPWEEISLSDYENHMKLDSVMQFNSSYGKIFRNL